MSGSLYVKIVGITNDYLGPASERFINRQIELHLKKSPEQLTPSDISKLAKAFKVSLSLITKDQQSVDEAVERLNSLAAADGGPVVSTTKSKDKV